MLLYRLCTDSNFFLTDGNDNISEQSSLIKLFHFSDEFKRAKLEKVTNPLAKNMISQLLTKGENT